MEHDHRQKTDWDFNVDGPIRGKGEYVEALPDRIIPPHERGEELFKYVQALPDRMISSHERGEELSKYVQALPDRMISEYETRSDALNSFRDRDGNTLSSQGIQNIHELQAQLSTAGLLNKDQGQRDDREPQGNRVNASGQEATVVAQR